MCKPHAGSQFVGVLVVCAVLALATSAIADTIYLKNGRRILTSDTRVEGGNVVFSQYGGEVTIPMSLVERIEEDEAQEPDPLPVSQPTSSDSAEQSGDQAESNTSAEDADPNAAVAAEDPKTTRDYWQQELLSIQNEREQLNTRLEELNREERAFLFSRRSTADTRRRIEETNDLLGALDEREVQLRDEARRLGIPPGWLRVAPRGGGGGS